MNRVMRVIVLRSIASTLLLASSIYPSVGLASARDGSPPLTISGSPGTLPRVSVFYYGAFTPSVKQRLIITRPAYVVIKTPGGSYKGAKTPTAGDIADLKAAGIRVISYISTGNLVGFEFASDSPPNDRAFVRSSIASVAAEGSDGIFFDEGGVGHRPSHADRYLQAPALTMYGQPNSWAGYTIEDYASYAHSLGLVTVLGTDFYEPQYLHANVFDIFDFVMTDENYTPRKPAGSEVGHESQSWVIGSGVNDAVTAAQYTNNALSQGFGAAYFCLNYGSLESWYESYMLLASGRSPVVNYQLTVTVSGQGTTTGYSPGTYQIPAGTVVTLGASPASGWVFKDWSNYPGWAENPTSWTMVEPVNITARFERSAPAPEPQPNRPPDLNPIGNKRAEVGTQLEFTVHAADPDGDPLDYSASGLPDGAIFSPSTQVFTWTPTRAGTFSGITFRATDGALTTSEDITITATRVPLVARLTIRIVVSFVRFLVKVLRVVPDSSTKITCAGPDEWVSAVPGVALFARAERNRIGY